MSQDLRAELINDPYKLLEEIDAWLSFNSSPSPDDLRNMRRTIRDCIDRKKLRDDLEKWPTKQFRP